MAVPSWKPFAVVAREASLPHLSGPRHLCSERLGGFLDALLDQRWDGGWKGCSGAGMLQGKGAIRKDLEKRSQWLCPPLGPQAVGFLSLPMACGMGFPSSTASLQAADPNRLSPAPTMVLVSHKSWVGAVCGQRGS